jgi:hypothetical protein
MAKEDLLTETRHIKRVFTSEERDEFLRQMFRLRDDVGEREDELEAFKTTKKAEIAVLEAEVGVIENNLRNGYEQVPVQCIVKYENNKAIYIQKSTGEFVEERPMTEREQLNLAGGFTDAEQIIRADSEKQMDDDKE